MNIRTAGFCAAVMILLCAAESCEMLGLRSEAGCGELRISLLRSQESLTRAGLYLPDTSEFLLTVKDSEGKIIYDGRFGDSPESFSLPEDSYTVTIMSEEFSKPEFDSPQFGEEQCILVPAGKVVDLKLVCRQMNSGVKLNVSPKFLDEYPGGVLILKSKLGRLVYKYSEKRIAYFKPGEIELVLNEGKSEKVLMARTLEAQEVFVLKVDVASSGGNASGDGKSSVSVSEETMRNWKSAVIVCGGDNGGGSESSDAMTVSEALESIGEEGVWVCGHIVGGDLSSSSASFQKPFESRTNLLLGPRSSTSDKETCLSVQLPTGEIRDALNLVDNPELLGRRICIKGNIVEAYYGIPGMKGVTEYELL